jgi:hypothetical protein
MREAAVLFGKRCALVGVVTDPPEATPGPHLPAIILLNAGIVHHVGPNRLSVKIARHLAALGCVVLRFDFSGIGDSQTRADHLPFAQSVVSETQEAMDYVQAARGAERFVLIGLCSGADIAFQTACCDGRVVGVGLLNAQGYQLGANEAVRAYIRQRRETRYYWQVARHHAGSWWKALRGQADYRSILRVLGGQCRSLFVPPPQVASGAQHITADMRRLLERGVHMLLVYAESEPSLDYLHLMLGEAQPAWHANGRWRLEVMQQTDHTFTPLRAQVHLLRLLGEWLPGVVGSH